MYLVWLLGKEHAADFGVENSDHQFCPPDQNDPFQNGSSTDTPDNKLNKYTFTLHIMFIPGNNWQHLYSGNQNEQAFIK